MEWKRSRQSASYANCGLCSSDKRIWRNCIVDNIDVEPDFLGNVQRVRGDSHSSLHYAYVLLYATWDCPQGTVMHIGYCYNL